MERFSSSLAKGLVFLVFIGLAAVPASAQTMGVLSGTVVDQSGAILPGANVVAVHTPTGTTYDTVSDGQGHFAIPNVRVGGPYKITATMTGFKEQSKEGFFVKLGDEAFMAFKLEVQAVSETVTVTAEANPLINPGRTGAASNVYKETIETLPTLNRSLNDFAKTNPHFNSDAGQGGLTVAGKNYRYNSIQIDGAVNNDLFGLASSGTPGGQAGTNPISLDAIQEIQLVIAPYDVRLGGFTGGGINAVTRSGSNAFHGTGYYFYRNQSMVGDGPLQKPLADFSNKQYGASLGGPIMKDKAFFFVTGEQTRRSAPSGFSVGGTGVDFGSQALVQRVHDILLNKYGFDPGGLQEFTYSRSSDKIFGRLDFNLARGHQLTIRHNFVNAGDDNFGSLNTTIYSLPNTSYRFSSKTNSTVAQLNSTFGSRKYNEARLVYTRIREARTFPQRFPYVQVFLPNGTSVVAGTEVSSQANALNQDSVELTDDFTFYTGNHQITVGTHNEFFKFANLFTQALFGSYTFNSVDFLDQGLAQAYSHTFSRTSDPFEQARFSVKQWGFYAGDQWRVRPDLTLTLGARIDLPRFADTPLANPKTQATFGYRTDVIPSPTQFSPRLGFNWNVTGDGKNQVRGGVGVFTGRTPYVWLSNQFSNTGIQFSSLSITRNATNKIPFITDPDKQPSQIGSVSGAASNSYNLVDPDFKYPSVLRYNVAYDRNLGIGGLIASAEFLYADNLQDILYKNVNLKPTGATAFDGRPTFTRVDPGTSGALLLTNTDKGRSWTANVKLERPFKNGLFASASYLYNDTTSVNDGTSSVANSQFANNPIPGDPNDPPVTLANYATGNRINLGLTYTFKIFKNVETTIAGFYNGQDGLPFKYIFASNNDVNTDTATGTGGNVNDLLYVPKSADEVVVQGGTWDDLNNFISGDAGLSKYRGQVVSRNATRLPWHNNVDVRLSFGIPVGKTKVELNADVQNFGNMFDHNGGKVFAEFFPGLAPIRLNGFQNGKPIYQLLFLSPTFAKGSLVDLASRWQAQLGARIRF